MYVWGNPKLWSYRQTTLRTIPFFVKTILHSIFSTAKLDLTILINNIDCFYVLLTPSVAGIKRLFEVLQHGLKYNIKQSAFMGFKGKNKGPSIAPPVCV